MIGNSLMHKAITKRSFWEMTIYTYIPVGVHRRFGGLSYQSPGVGRASNQLDVGNMLLRNVS
jgi:hypothetical protein